MNKNEYIPKKQSRIVLRWLLFFTALVVTFVIAFMYCTYLFWSVKSPDIIKFNSSYAIYILGICLTLIPLSLIIYPEVLYGIPNNKDSIFVKSSAPSETQQKLYIEKDTIKPISDSLSKDIEPRFIELSESILKFIKEKNLYLNSNFSMEELSRAMDVPKHHLYYCFNSVLKTKLTDLRSELRVDYAKQLIEDGLLDHFTLDVVGNKVGFSTRSSFQSTFKKIEGCSPGEYRKTKS